MKTRETERMINLTDGVFAIVMTLLVLELSIPVIAGTSVGDTLGEKLLAMWPKYVGYLVSFLLLGLFWAYHNTIFTYVKRSDGRFFWLNLLFLMAVALVPFAASLASQYWQESVAVALYGLILLLPFTVAWLSFLYAIKGNRLVGAETPPALARRERTAGLFVVFYFCAAICLSFAMPVISLILYGLMPIYYLITSLSGREGLAGRGANTNEVRL